MTFRYFPHYSDADTQLNTIELNLQAGLEGFEYEPLFCRASRDVFYQWYLYQMVTRKKVRTWGAILAMCLVYGNFSRSITVANVKLGLK